MNVPRGIPRLLREASWEEVEPLVRLVPQYRVLQGVVLSVIATQEIQSLAKFVGRERSAFADSLCDQMIRAGITPFLPIVAEVGQLIRLVVPPVVEMHQGLPVLVDGTHRIWAARRRGLPEVFVVLIGGIDLPLPSRVVSWESVTERSEPYTTEENLVDFQRALFRPTTTTFNGPATLLGEYPETPFHRRKRHESCFSGSK
jgi:hypothetical protein